MNIHTHIFVWTYFLKIYFRYIPKFHSIGITISRGNSMFNLLKSHQTAFESGRTISIPPPNKVWVIQFLHILTNACWYPFIKAILVDIKWDLIMVLICMFQATSVA